ncbi:MAG: SDR family oxidoreductase [Kiritimatiellae bacterium]|nr:SDR family oxidoreductase [Kiritimatiellia bacterium]
MLSSLFSLDNKTALVTGGNTGIGFGIARGLAEAGARVAISGRDRKKNAEALAALGAVREGCVARVFDLADTAGIEAFYEKVSREMSGLDILVNNAGITVRGKTEELTLGDWEGVMRVNLTAPFVLSQCYARERIGNKTGGSIVLIGSLMCEATRPTVAAYTASKGGIRQLVKQLATDWAPHGIRVNGVGPGYIRTDMTAPLVENEEFNGWVLKRTPLGRWGVPEDLAPAAVFLASEAAAFITGQMLYVDGGWLATF